MLITDNSLCRIIIGLLRESEAISHQAGPVSQRLADPLNYINILIIALERPRGFKNMFKKEARTKLKNPKRSNRTSFGN